MEINGIEIDPAANPAVLDTCTWDPPAAQALIEESADALAACAAAVDAAPVRESLDRTLGAVKGAVPESAAVLDGTGYFLMALDDGQRALIGAGGGASGAPVRIGTAAGSHAVIFPVNAATVKWLVTHLLPQFAPKALGGQPRLGVGARHSTIAWPGIISAVNSLAKPAETIQNSAYRELAPLDMILSPPGEETAWLPGHGSVSIGHTGSSIEGFWLAGVLAHVEHGVRQPYGADLDHVPVRALTDEGLAKARQIIEAGRHYSFFTLDTSAMFDFSKEDLGERYGSAIEAAAELYRFIKAVRWGEPFDFEFSLDEGPMITEPAELRFVLERLAAEGVEVPFVAPNFGFVKREDYGRPDGMEGLASRVRELAAIASEYGAVLDFHSGSDKSPLTYRTIAEAAGGRLKLKVSGRLQVILGEVLAEDEPDFFREWWNYSLERARAEKDAGSEVAARFVAQVEQRIQAGGAGFRALPSDRFFTDFAYAMPGAKSPEGEFLYRDRFYALSAATLEHYSARVREYIEGLSRDLGLD